MNKRQHTPEQIVRKLREADRMLGEGSPVLASRQLKITEQAYYRSRNQHGEMKADDAKRLKELERESSRLKKNDADKALDIDTLKKVNQGNFPVRRNAGQQPCI